MAKWIRRLTTDQEIPGSIPGRFDFCTEYKSLSLSLSLSLKLLYISRILMHIKVPGKFKYCIGYNIALFIIALLSKEMIQIYLYIEFFNISA